jgi:pyridoxamine 5'-phosphate oxidase
MPSPDPIKATTNPAGLRREYTADELNESDLAADPIDQFGQWFADATAASVREANAMTLATVDSAGRPSARIVLLKGFDQKGFVFYTSYTSRKAHELENNPRACLVFFWHTLERQVRIDGTVEKVSREESEKYFRVRPVESQIGAWASHQSRVIGSREELQLRHEEIRKRFAGGEIPTPPFWGGYRVRPTEIEFWQGRVGRLHDRLVYVRTGDAWKLQRLSP